MKESEGGFTGEDVLEGLTAVISVKLREIQFEGQTKGKLGSMEAQGAVATVFGEAFANFLEENPDIVRKYLEIRNNIVSEIKTNPSNYAELIQKKTSIPLKEITHLMELYDFSARLTEKDIVDLKKTFNYLKKQDLVKVQSLNYAIIRIQNLSK